MYALALTLEGSRSFSDGVVVTWNPSMTDNSVTAQIEIGGDLVWSDEFYGDDVEHVDTAGDNWSIGGSLSTVFQADGIHGQLDGVLSWEVQGDSHYYKGLIGIW